MPDLPSGGHGRGQPAGAREHDKRHYITGLLPEEVLASEDFKRCADYCVNCKMCRIECPSAVDVPKLDAGVAAQYAARRGLTRAEKTLSRAKPMSILNRCTAPIANFMGRSGTVPGVSGEGGRGGSAGGSCRGSLRVVPVAVQGAANGELLEHAADRPRVVLRGPVRELQRSFAGAGGDGGAAAQRDRRQSAGADGLRHARGSTTATSSTPGSPSPSTSGSLTPRSPGRPQDRLQRTDSGACASRRSTCT